MERYEGDAHTNADMQPFCLHFFEPCRLDKVSFGHDPASTPLSSFRAEDRIRHDAHRFLESWMKSWMKQTLESEFTCLSEPSPYRKALL